MAQNPYTVLGISKTASQDEVRAAYRKLAKKYHPDLNPGNKDAEKKFKEINTANGILSEPAERAKFDRGEIDESGGQKQAPPQGPSFYETQKNGGRYSSSSFSDIDPDLFESIFGRGFGGSRGGPRAPRESLYSLEVDFKDSILGAEKEIELPGGKRLKVKIPAGIETGQKLRLKNLADGDALVEIAVRPSHRFQRVGLNLELEVPVLFSEVVLGAEIKVPTLEGSVLVKVPKTANSGTKLRVRGKGVAVAPSPGDLILNLKIVMPPEVDSDLTSAVKKWSQTQSYDPRQQLEAERD